MPSPLILQPIKDPREAYVKGEATPELLQRVAELEQQVQLGEDFTLAQRLSQARDLTGRPYYAGPSGFVDMAYPEVQDALRAAQKRAIFDGVLEGTASEGITRETAGKDQGRHWVREVSGVGDRKEWDIFDWRRPLPGRFVGVLELQARDQIRSFDWYLGKLGTGKVADERRREVGDIRKGYYDVMKEYYQQSYGVPD